MNHTYRLSVIIPVYNVESYIEKCLDSVLQQSDETIEIICVNDSSPDGSRRIIEDYLTKYPNIKCIDRPNGGLSAARNTGMQEAKGEYVVFLDSDDWLENGVLFPLYQQAKEDDLDILIGNTKWIYPDNKTHLEQFNCADIITGVINGKNAIVKLMEKNIYVPMAYNYVCKREYLVKNRFLFQEGVLYEDELWTPQILLSASRVHATSIYHYNYFQRENTITNSVGTQLKIESLFYISKKLITLSSTGRNKSLRGCLWVRACNIFSKGVKMNMELNAGFNQPYLIGWMDLMKANLSFDSFNTCLGFLSYSKTQRRIFRLLHNFFCVRNFK